LFITLDHGAEIPIVAGQSLKGKVVLNVQRGGLPAGDLNLRLIGTEYTIIPTRKGTKREERTIARAFTKLRGFAGGRKIATGLYSLPFEFVLPSSLPSSTTFPKLGSKNFQGKIQYYLGCEMGELCHRQEFFVQSAPMGNSIVPCIAEPTTHELKRARVLKKGFLSVAASVDNTHVGRGQKLKVSIASRNGSSCDIDRVSVKLVELIEYRAQGEESTIKNDLVEIKDVNLPGVIKCRAKDNEKTSKKKLKDQSMITMYQEILRDLEGGQNTFQIGPVPRSARDSYDGTLVNIQHYLKITFHTGVSVENPTTKIPIKIGSKGGIDEIPRGNEPIATVVDPHPSEMTDPSGDDSASTVTVGYDIPIPMVDARVLPPLHNQSPDTVYPLDPNVGAPFRPARILPYSSDDDDDDDRSDGLQCRSIVMPVPSAPHESLLLEEVARTPPRESLRQQARSDYRLPTHAYAPYAMYNSSPQRDRIDSAMDSSIAESTAASSYQHEILRERIDSYSYDETTAISDLTEANRPQLGHGQLPFYATPTKQAMSEGNYSRVLFDSLVRELRASIHDYEVISGKSRQAEYRELFSSLTPKQLGQIIATVSISYQVMVAVVLARIMGHELFFTCAHCAEAVNKTSHYFRTNMVEALLPYIDYDEFTQNRSLIESELSSWETLVTKRAFEKHE